jgi:hypothetical protein
MAVSFQLGIVETTASRITASAWSIEATRSCATSMWTSSNSLSSGNSQIVAPMPLDRCVITHCATHLRLMCLVRLANFVMQHGNTPKNCAMVVNAHR